MNGKQRDECKRIRMDPCLSTNRHIGTPDQQAKTCHRPKNEAACRSPQFVALMDGIICFGKAWTSACIQGGLP